MCKKRMKLFIQLFKLAAQLMFHYKSILSAEFIRLT